MAKVKIQGHASGTGVITLTAPNTSTDRTITLPDATGTLATTADTLDPDGAVVFNESGADVDFRVESDTNANGLFFDGGNGNLGVGTASPTNFSGYTTLGVDAATGGLIEIMVGGTRTANIQASATESHVQTRTATPLIFSTNNTERLKLTSDGRGLSQFTAKVWVHIDSGTLADGHNVSSITDNGSGEYQINFANNLANDNYSSTTSNPYRNGSGRRALINTYNPNVNNINIAVFEYNTSWYAYDLDKCTMTIFGD
jgi:hypothetical protein